MAVLQYIGARYVPKIFNDGNGGAEWEADRHYEALTIVTYNGSSYTSRTPVPASIGNPAQNPGYWALSGFPNGQILDLQQRVVSLEQKERGSVNLKSRRFLFVGDSYSLNTAKYTGWGTSLKDASELFGLDITVLSRGGCGFVADGSNTWHALLSGQSDLSSYTDIYILGGANDQNASVADILNAVYALRSLLLPTGARFAYGFIGHSVQRASSAPMFKAYGATYRSCDLAAFPVISSAYGWLNKRSDFLNGPGDDGRHPTTAGNRKVAYRIMQEIFSTYVPLIEDYSCNVHYGEYTKQLFGTIPIKQEAATYPAGHATINVPYESLPDFVFMESEEEFPVILSIKGLMLNAVVYPKSGFFQIGFTAPQELADVTSFFLRIAQPLPYGII